MLGSFVACLAHPWFPNLDQLNPAFIEKDILTSMSPSSGLRGCSAPSKSCASAHFSATAEGVKVSSGLQMAPFISLTYGRLLSGQDIPFDLSHLTSEKNPAPNSNIRPLTSGPCGNIQNLHKCISIVPSDVHS